MDEKDKTTFLLVSSDRPQREDMSVHIKAAGYQSIHQADNGADAWRLIKNFDIGLVISDWELPDMTGLVFLKIIRADNLLEELPCILAVQEITAEQVIEAGQAGVSDIITIPPTAESIKTKLEGIFSEVHAAQDKDFEQGFAKGLDYMKSGDYQLALNEFNRILNVYESAETYYNIGYIRAAQKRYEEAIINFRRATQIDSAYAKAYKKMADVYALMGRMDEAQKCLEQAAEIYMESQMDSEAEKVLLEAVRINPNTINVYNTLGIVYRRQGNYQEAVRFYIKALKVTPKDENIMFNLARVYMAIKNFDQARHVLRKSLTINPDFAEAEKLLKSLEMGTGL